MEIALKEFPKLSSREIAAVCAVGDQLVNSVRDAVQPRDSRSCETRTGADGKSYPATKPAKTPGMKMLESMGATFPSLKPENPLQFETGVSRDSPPSHGGQLQAPGVSTTTGVPLRAAGGLLQIPLRRTIADSRSDKAPQQA